MDLSGATIVVKAKLAGDSFSFNGQQYTSNDNGLAEVPVECVNHVQSFGFAQTDQKIISPGTNTPPATNKK
jgi:anthranilate/para-aminobenzoate synthase component II